MKRYSLVAPVLLGLAACTSHAPTALTAVATPQPKRPIVALVLGGGGARGFAHVGAIQSLESHGIRPDLVVGTSVGALVGAVYASGKSPSELEHIATTITPKDIIDISPSKQGLIDGTRLRHYVNQQVNHRPIEKFPMRYAAVATLATTKTATAFTLGEAGIAVQASASVPNLFIAPRIPDKYGQKYTDGSQSALLPAQIAKNLGADVVIAVDLMSDNRSDTAKAKTKPAKPTTTDNPATSTDDGRRISIGHDQTHIHAQWGEQRIAIPINLTELNEAGKALPFELPLGDIVGNIIKSIPANTELDIPKGLSNQLPTNTHEFWQVFGNIGANARAADADIKASDVIIEPEIADISVMDMASRHQLIEQGKIATDAKIDAIKQAIAAAHAKSPSVQ
ncbi:patatin-like phospholipase family protein [Moraxella marmotae]|uniref:patatin-like phospholipase family protein n=1 Tax=Moraxella marmotae TaxID=3344520 RepID=UPI0035F49A4A